MFGTVGGVIHLEFQVRDDGGEVGISIAFSIPIHGSLHHDSSCFHTGYTHGYANSCIVMAMHPNFRIRKFVHHIIGDITKWGYQFSAIGFTQGQKSPLHHGWLLRELRGHTQHCLNTRQRSVPHHRRPLYPVL